MTKLEIIGAVSAVASLVFLIVGWHIENVRKGFREINDAIKTQADLDG